MWKHISYLNFLGLQFPKRSTILVQVFPNISCSNTGTVQANCPDTLTICINIYFLSYISVVHSIVWKIITEAVLTSIHRQMGCPRLQSDAACSSLDPHSRYQEEDSPRLCELQCKEGNLNNMTQDK